MKRLLLVLVVLVMLVLPAMAYDLDVYVDAQVSTASGNVVTVFQLQSYNTLYEINFVPDVAGVDFDGGGTDINVYDNSNNLIGTCDATLTGGDADNNGIDIVFDIDLSGLHSGDYIKTEQFAITYDGGAGGGCKMGNPSGVPDSPRIAFGSGGTSPLGHHYVTWTDPYAITANFNATPQNGTLPLNVQFNDLSTGTPTYWSWDFGDGFYYSGQSAFAQNPTHTYTVIGSFNVSLFIQNDIGSDTEEKDYYINVTSAVGAYNLKVNPLTKNLTSMSGVNISVWTDSGYTSFYNNQTTTAYIPYYSASLPSNAEYYILMNKTGYFDRHYTVYMNQNREIDLVMYAISEGNLEVSDYTAIHVYPYNTYTGATVSGALVSYYTDSGRTTLYASSYVVGSAASAYLLQNETYYGRITASGYYPYDFSVATGTSASIERTYHLNPYTTPSTTGTGTPGPTPTYMTIATLSQAERDYKVSTGMDVWYENADFLSNLFFLAVVIGTLGLMSGSMQMRRRGR